MKLILTEGSGDGHCLGSRECTTPGVCAGCCRMLQCGKIHARALVCIENARLRLDTGLLQGIQFACALRLCAWAWCSSCDDCIGMRRAGCFTVHWQEPWSVTPRFVLCIE